MSVKHFQDLPLEPVAAGEKTSKQVLISSEEGPNFAMRRFVIEAGGFMPLHTNSVEHEQFCIGGEAEVVIGEELVTVKKNDVVFIPANVPHSYRTTSSEAFEFLCLVPNQEDVIDIKE
ncbi:MAG: cupin domain-containing protein [Candidatus Marinimicrobia bacterium]|jgi:quercetin dioxygenase-like cupin family protein|nr:cupin domain-containing protein [Candidatus Neomarinimicrobiota bacterium]MBT3631897.1 cupin domain-containing protein [Candidatus Neomarinimicrobiota bacterium]MBT3824456.1 cupin domain-containing protein [Candidatus Neomarinimicrobiota bacterium]MBT4131136.1 cupin domain-containing protein [Candidatus Neomarinimicrobiota bacterium]MBT4296746.1 cupin domain-containing protein [Candidatus Neomarinimicrobiota bacterium]